MVSDKALRKDKDREIESKIISTSSPQKKKKKKNIIVFKVV
jgi:hypothetical protein